MSAETIKNNAHTHTQIFWLFLSTHHPRPGEYNLLGELVTEANNIWVFLFPFF